MKANHRAAGFMLVEVMIAVFIVTSITVPLASVLITTHRSTAWAQENMQALTLGQAHMEELLASGSEAWVSQPFLPVSANPDYDLAVVVKPLPARLYEIRVLIRWGDSSDDQAFELATLATSTGRFQP